MSHGEHLVGAYGLHWKRNEVAWLPGPGRGWQMLGRRGTRSPGLRVCDFRYAAGIYVLERRGRPVYVGLARSAEGFGARLRRHHKQGTKDWTAFSWFAFDDVLFAEPRKTYPNFRKGWAWVDPREVLGKSSMNKAVAEQEALIVNMLKNSGLVNIQRPKFAKAQEWTQVTGQNYGPGGICHGVDRDGFSDLRPFERAAQRRPTG